MRVTVHKLLFGFLVFLIACSQQSGETDELVDKLLNSFNSEQYEKAVQFADELLKKEPSNHVAYAIKGRALYNLGNAEEGLSSLAMAIELNPGYHQAFSYRSAIFQELRKYDLALDDINKALELNPENAQYLFSRASIKHFAKDHAGAEDDYTTLLEVYPGNYDLLVFRGSARRKNKEYIEALEDIEKAIHMHPEKSFAYEEKGNLFKDKGENQKAIDFYSKSISLLTSDDSPEIWADTYDSRGVAYFRNGQIDQALEDFNNSLITFQNASAYKNRAKLRINEGLFEEACVDLTEAQGLNPREDTSKEIVELIAKHCQ